MEQKQSCKYTLKKGGLVLVFGALTSPVLADSGIAVSAEAGYRHDNLNWNIADVDGSPNILSELTWSSLRIYQGKLNLEVDIKQLKFFGTAAYGTVDDGDNQDSDYLADDRQAEFSRSNNQAGGDVADASLGIGYVFKAGVSDNFHSFVMPMAGYSLHQQNLEMTDGFQTIPATGSFDGLNSSYDAQWDGPWIGLSFWQTDIRRDFTIAFDMIYHQADYQAEATWNLRTTGDFALAQPTSFEHWADGQGITLSLRSKYGLSRQWSFIMSLDYQNWQTDAGLDRVYPAAGGSEDTQLNRVNWDSTALNLGFEWRPGD